MSKISRRAFVSFLGGLALMICVPGCQGAEPSGTPDPSSPTEFVGAVCGRDVVGGFCDGRLGCPDNVGCNWCACSKEGLVCNLAFCPSRVKKSCRATADCPTDEDCIYDPDCSATAGRCVRRDTCAYPPLMNASIPSSPFVFCDCSDKTVTQPTGCGISQPYKRFGPC